MRIVAKYEVKEGEKVLKQNYSYELQEVYEIIQSVSAEKCFTKVSKEKTMKGKILYSPIKLNKLFKQEFIKRGWKSVKVPCKYNPNYIIIQLIQKCPTAQCNTAPSP